MHIYQKVQVIIIHRIMKPIAGGRACSYNYGKSVQLMFNIQFQILGWIPICVVKQFDTRLFSWVKVQVWGLSGIEVLVYIKNIKCFDAAPCPAPPPSASNPPDQLDSLWCLELLLLWVLPQGHHKDYSSPKKFMLMIIRHWINPSILQTCTQELLL